jgi:hypothetical protein
MEIVNEKSTCILTVSFKDEDGAAVVPSSGNYRIDVLNADGTYSQVKGDAALPSLAAEVDIEITDEENAMLDPAVNSEQRVVTVTFSYGTGKAGSAEYFYRLKNLGKVS